MMTNTASDEVDLPIRDGFGAAVTCAADYEAGVYFLWYDQHLLTDGSQFRSQVGES